MVNESCRQPEPFPLPTNLQQPIPVALFESTREQLHIAKVMLAKLFRRGGIVVEYASPNEMAEHPALTMVTLPGGRGVVRMES